MSKKIFKNRKNDFAILGLVFSIFGGLPGLIFSIIGLNQIKKTGQEGKGMCIAGIIVSSVWFVLSIIFSIFLIGVIVAEEMYLYDYDEPDIYDMTDYEKCNSYWTDCEDYSWECEEDGCWCTYDDGYDYDYFWCDSWDFE